MFVGKKRFEIVVKVAKKAIKAMTYAWSNYLVFFLFFRLCFFLSVLSTDLARTMCNLCVIGDNQGYY